MTVFFGIIMGILGPDLMHTIDKGFDQNTNFLFYILEKSLNFAVYLSILQMGVRMFVSELTESFKVFQIKYFGISTSCRLCSNLWIWTSKCSYYWILIWSSRSIYSNNRTCSFPKSSAYNKWIRTIIL